MQRVSKLCQEGRLKEALQVVDLMAEQGSWASIKIYTHLLQGCIRMKALAEGKQVHAHILQHGYNSNIFLGNTLVNMYAKCGSLHDARRVFDVMCEHDVFSWTAIISAYANQQQDEEAIDLFQKMQQAGVVPDKFVFVIVLKACASLAALKSGKQVHACIIKHGCESDIFVGNTLIGMYSKCGSIDNARKVFNRMNERDVISWNAMIAGYAQQGHDDEAITLFEQMQGEGVKPDSVTFVSILKACGSLAARERLKQIHAHIIDSGFESDVTVGTTLVRMYAKCKNLEDARQVFNRIYERNVVLWNAMIAAYVWEGHGEEALRLFDQMQLEGVKPNSFTFGSILKACASLATVERGKQVHAQVIQSGFESDAFVGSILVNMYAKCGSIEDARLVFNRMHQRDVVLWTAMIAGYVHQGHDEEALTLFDQMQREGVKPNIITFASILKACGNLAALQRGKQVHAYVIKSGFQLDFFVGSTLIGMYAKCGSIEDAHQVFNTMHKRDVVSWTSMIAGYVQQGHGEKALILFEQMQREGLTPDKVTFVTIIKACACLASLEWGKQVHAQVIKRGFASDVVVENTLIDMYAKCGSIEDARQVFDKMHERDVVSWTAMIAGYAQQGHGNTSLILFEQMQQEGVKPNNVTFASILNACTTPAALEWGKKVHAHSIRSGFDADVTVGNALISMYAKCARVEDARLVFDKMRKQDVVSWTAMISGYVQQGHGEEAFTLFEQMQQKGVKPDTVTFTSILKACASLSALEQGKQFHAQIIKSGLEFDVSVGTALVCMYAKCGSVGDARLVFDSVHDRDAMLWNAMIAGYAQQGHGEESLTLFEQMQCEGVKPDKVTFVSILKACANLAALQRGKQVHTQFIKSGLELDVSVGNTLVSMYAKCGSIEDACRIFDRMCDRDAVSWNVMIAGYAQQGHGKRALALFEQMQLEGVKPDEVTFVCVLTACSYAGLVDEGRQQFDSLARDHGITPTMKHYACMVDLLGRAGHLDQAEDFINQMPIKPNAVVWMTLLGACRSHGNVELGRYAFEYIRKSKPKCTRAYVLLSNIYALAGRWDEVAKIKTDMENAGVKKESGCNWIEVNNEVHAFFVGDRTHKQTKEIHAELDV